MSVVILIGALLCPAADAAVSVATVSGIVKDGQGTAQMGALVQVLAEHSRTVGTAFTDQHGRYTISNLTSGRYVVRASQTLFVPTTRGNLQLNAGATTFVNLTLAALFDTTSWLPAAGRGANEPDDDWKWTLRSTANRPILRLVEDGKLIEISSSAEMQRASASKAKATVASGDGGFGAGGIHHIVTIRTTLEDGSDAMLRADVGSSRVPTSFGPSQEIEAGFEHKMGYDGAARTVASYKSHPELAGGGATNGLTVVELTSSQRANLADVIELEAGGRAEALRTSQTALKAYPFLKLTGHIGGGWTVSYRLATARELQGFEDVTTGRAEIPVALVENGQLRLADGRHQEVAMAMKKGRGGLEAVFYHDVLDRTAVSGGGASGPAETQSAPVQGGMLVDPTTGSFRALAVGYRTSGARVTASAPITAGLWVAAEYSAGTALGSTTGADATFQQSLAGLKARRAQAATIALKGKVIGSQTQLRASYRWQQAQLVSAVDSYSAFSEQAYLSCSIRQPIHLGEHLPQGLGATVDVTNLLAEGYRPFVSADGQTLYFAQAPRTIQAGLSFSF